MNPARRPILIAAAAAVAALLTSPSGAAAAAGDWPTWHLDTTRTGNDTNGGAATTLQPLWTSANLDGTVYASPLVAGGHVIVATEGDSIYSLDVASGGVVWVRTVGTPVPNSSLAPGCGNIDPVGITGTPAIDTATGTIFAVAQVRASEYDLVAIDLPSGRLKFQHAIPNPSGFDPRFQIQRAALALGSGMVYMNFGGRAGDCQPYHGWIMAAREDGAGGFTQYNVQTSGQDTTPMEAGLWAAAGPSVDGTGNVYVATGNGASTGAYDVGNSVLKLSPSLSLLDSWAATDWAALNGSDTDVGSAGPMLLNGGSLIFQAGKSGVGYLLKGSALSANSNHIGGEAFTSTICTTSGDAIFGGYAAAGTTIYVPCREGLRALQLNMSAPSFAALPGWTVPTFEPTAPIVSGGIVWTLDLVSGNLDGLNPATGQILYTQNVGGLTHFATLAASNNRLFAASGNQIMGFFTNPPIVSAVAPASGPTCGGTSVVITGSQFVGASAVQFAGVNALSYTVDSDTQITALAPAASPGQVDITVRGPSGTSLLSANDRFTYATPLTPPPPVVTGVRPQTGPPAGGTPVSITGVCLSGATAVTFGATPGTGVTSTATSATATSPRELGGTVDVRVTTPGGTSAISSADRFTFVAGYWLTASDGGIFTYGNVGYYGSTGNIHLNQPIRGMARTPDDGGYWLVATDGGIFTFGDAGYFGSTGNIVLNKPVVGMAASPDGKGYWLVASDGGIFTFGSAQYFGSTGNLRLNKPIVGMAATPDAKGYWLVASDGGIFTFGDAGYFGSTGNITLNKPVVAMAATVDGKGYWLTASDGGIFTFGDAGYHGSTGNITLNRPVVGMAATADGKGYWLVASDGGIFTFGDAIYYGSAGGLTLNQPIVGMATS